MARTKNDFVIKGTHYVKFVGVDAFFTDSEMKNAKARFKRLKKHGGKT